ncbi:hypothetical protein ACJMK2_020826 [Sinanodonta woodiana]|uniref:Uncharacterized protein n=1 Tax=Sinanodonta woodiana TaxID=1069815 RepID=A0ABD3U323_SINWO
MFCSFLLELQSCGLGETCFYNDRSSVSMKSMYCSRGCCGDYYNQYCCVNVPGIVGGVIGFLFFVVIIITVSCLCCGCCRSTRQNFAGYVFRTNRNPPMTAIAVQQPGYVQQPVYGQSYVIQNAGYHSVQTQYPPGNTVYVQGDAKTGYPTEPANYHAAQAPPPYMA